MTDKDLVRITRSDKGLKVEWSLETGEEVRFVLSQFEKITKERLAKVKRAEEKQQSGKLNILDNKFESMSEEEIDAIKKDILGLMDCKDYTELESKIIKMDEKELMKIFESISGLIEGK